MTDAQKRKRNLSSSAKLFVAVVIIALGLAGFGGYEWYKGVINPTTTSRTGVANDGNLLVTSDEEVIANIAEKVSPSVVSITTNTVRQSYLGATQGEAAGTGIIVSKDGYILTNKHVIDGAQRIEVFLSDGTSYSDVTVVGADPLNDVAFLKIKDAKDLTAATLGDSSTVRVGQEVVAIGNSLGQYQNTVTSGVISGKGRPITAGDGSGQSTERLTDLLQTDAAINPGNSGGPLLNRAGQVIGINTAVAADAQGIGFAIPINATKGELKSVLAGNGVKRAYLGVRYVPLTAASAKSYNLTLKEGAYVIGNNNQPAVEVGGPADKAGVKEKDIITSVNGLVVGKEGGVSSLIGEYAPGDTVKLIVNRQGKTVELTVTLGSYR
jgi:serine protease Do